MVLFTSIILKKTVVICLIISITFPFDAGGQRTSYIRVFDYAGSINYIHDPKKINVGKILGLGQT